MKRGKTMTKLQAHRGVSYEYPENTMVAYEAAIKQGYGIIELDPVFDYVLIFSRWRRHLREKFRR